MVFHNEEKTQRSVASFAEFILSFWENKIFLTLLINRTSLTTKVLEKNKGWLFNKVKLALKFTNLISEWD